MELDTKQVRAIVNPIAGFGAQYTEKTKQNPLAARRSVVYVFYSASTADDCLSKIVAEFNAQGFANTVTRTATGGYPYLEYVRIKANIA
jgi:hypothetical protein